MSRDTTATIATEYGKAFSSSGQGMFSSAAAAGVAGMGNPWPSRHAGPADHARAVGRDHGGAERGAAGPRREPGPPELRDERARLEQRERLVVDAFSQNAMKNNGELHRRFSELQAYFQQRFAAPSADGDLNF